MTGILLSILVHSSIWLVIYSMRTIDMIYRDHDKHLCVESNPWTIDKGPAQHPDVECVSNSDRGCLVWRCPWCGLEFSPGPCENE